MIIYIQKKGSVTMYKKRLALFMISVFCILPFIQHTHDEDCGYDAETDSGCVYEVEVMIDGYLGN